MTDLPPEVDMSRIRAQDFPGPTSLAGDRMLEEPFLVGLALPSQQGASLFSNVDTGTSWHWDYLERVARCADDIGLTHLFLGSQYFPPGGFAGRHRTHAHEALALTGALAAVTSNVYLICTASCIGEMNPLLFSRMIATLDHVSNGRIGINVMANLAFGDFGGRFSALTELAERYEAADEFVELAKRLWTTNGYIRYSGKFFDVPEGYISPKPLQKRLPLIMTADLAPSTRTFLSRHCDLAFLTPKSELPVARVAPREADSSQLAVRGIAQLLVICRETEAEAKTVAESLVAQLDREALRGHVEKFKIGGLDHSRLTEFAFGGVSAFPPAIGTPDQVVEHFEALRRRGVDGVNVTFIDFEPELEFFGRRVVPLLRTAGLWSSKYMPS